MKNAMDLESIPNKSMVDQLPEPEVALGNVKDPAKIEEKIKEAKKKQIDKMALNPFWGRICSFSMHGETESFFKVIPDISDASEIELVSFILEKLVIGQGDENNIITWNGHGFDFPFIYKRAALLNIPLPQYCPSLKYWTRKYSQSPHCDLMQEFCGWSTEGKTNLDLAGKMFLGAGKTKRDYSEYINLIESGQGELIGLDNLCDTQITFNLYKKLEPYLF